MEEAGNFLLKYAPSPNTPITVTDKHPKTPQSNATTWYNTLSNAYV